MKMSNDPAKYEVLIKQYLRLILDISALPLPGTRSRLCTRAIVLGPMEYQVFECNTTVYFVLVRNHHCSCTKFERSLDVLHTAILTQQWQ